MLRPFIKSIFIELWVWNKILTTVCPEAIAGVDLPEIVYWYIFRKIFVINLGIERMTQSVLGF